MTGAEADLASHAETADSLSLVFLVLLERLSPVQRAVFLLHEVFGYGYAEIAGWSRSEDNCCQDCRQGPLPRRGRPPSGSSRPGRCREELARRFFAAVEEGDTEGLVGCYDDVVMYGDGVAARPSPWPPPSTAPRRSPGSSSA